MNNDKMTENKDITVEEHVAITREDAFEFLFTNEKLQNFVKQYSMIFIDGYFVVAAPKYIERSQDGKNTRIQLTKWARENLASCSINICRVHRSGEHMSEDSYPNAQTSNTSIAFRDNESDENTPNNNASSEDNESSGIATKRHTSSSNFIATDFYKRAVLAIENRQDTTNKITTFKIAANIITAATATIVDDVAVAVELFPTVAAALFPIIPLITFTPILFRPSFGSAERKTRIPALSASEAAKKFLEEAYDQTLPAIDRRILLLNADCVAVLNETLLIEESKGIHGKLHNITSDDVYSSALEFLFTEEYVMERDFDKLLGNPEMSLSNCLNSMMDLKGFNSANTFWDRTLLHKNYYYDIKNDHFNNPTKETLMALCVGLGLTLHVVEKVLSKAGFVLREHDDPDRAYRLILGRFPGLSIDDFNNLLARAGIKPLGTAIKETKED